MICLSKLRWSISVSIYFWFDEIMSLQTKNCVKLIRRYFLTEWKLGFQKDFFITPSYLEPVPKKEMLTQEDPSLNANFYERDLFRNQEFNLIWASRFIRDDTKVFISRKFCIWFGDGNVRQNWKSILAVFREIAFLSL